MQGYRESRQIRRARTIILPAAPDIVFPLFGPIGEKQWAEGWEPEMIYPRSGETKRDAVFTVAHGHHGPAIWTVSEFSPEEFLIAYVAVVSAVRVTRIAIRCEAVEEERTKAHVEYTHTSLSEEGNAYLESVTEAAYDRYMESWRDAISHFLKHGRVLEHEGS